MQSGSGSGITNATSIPDCHVFTANEIRNITIIKLTLTVVAILLCVCSIVAILVLKQYRTFVHRLVLYLMIVAIFQAGSIGLDVAPVHHNGQNVEVRPGFEGACVAVGFAVQVFQSQLSMVFAWIIIYLFVMVTFKYRLNSKKQEIAGLVITLGFPLTFSWVPFINDMYGLSGAWCWIKDSRSDCKFNTLGVTLQFSLFYAPMALLILISTVLFLVMVITFCKQNFSHIIANGGTYRSPYRQAVKETLLLLLYPLLYNILLGVMIGSRIHYSIAISHHQRPSYILWLAHAVVDPIRVLFIPFAFLLHPGTLKNLYRKTCKRKENIDSDTHFPVPKESSISDVDPLIIRGRRYTNRHGRSMYNSIFDSDQQHSGSV